MVNDRTRLRNIALDKLDAHTAMFNDAPGTHAEATIRRFEDELSEAVKQYAIVSGQTSLEAIIELQRERISKGGK